MKLDKLHRQIIAILQCNGRTPYSDMAKELGVSEATVRRRTEALEKEGVIRITAMTDPYSVGLHTPAYIYLHVEPGSLDSVCDELVKRPEVRYVVCTTGNYDITVEALFPSNYQLLPFINEFIGSLPGVQKVETSIQLQVRKRVYAWQLPEGDSAYTDAKVAQTNHSGYLDHAHSTKS